MRKSVWILIAIGLGGVFVMGLGGLAFLRQTPGVEAFLALKDRLEREFRPDSAVVSADRDLPGKHGLVVILTWEDPPPWDDDEGARERARDVGKSAWLAYAPPEGRSLDRVTVVLRVDRGWGCSGPKEACRLEVPNPRVDGEKPPGRRS